MAHEIPKAYEPQEIEECWARVWFERKLFRADPKAPGPVFSIVIPPPNVTGSLHIGHMLDHTEIDVLARWRRMCGFNTLYLPGTDHAGIGTQVVLERELAKEGLTRQKIGREAFEARIWKWKEESGRTIKEQMVRLGESCDWTRERFTLDAGLSRTVREVFVRLHEEGLIYRGRYLVNWCPRCQTAVSDLESVHVERAGKLWHIRYSLAGEKGYLVVATTRPETLLGDTAVAVHPEDKRYADVVGKRVLLPLMGREIPVIADRYVDREFGTGVVKVTPAHDPNDFEVGRRHGLPEVDVMTDDAHMSAAAGKYAGMERFAAREKIVTDLTVLGLLERVANHTYAVGTCDRCKTDIEPRLSTQWFVKMKPLAEPAIGVVERGEIEIIPESWRTVYFEWMRNIRDWCISRQLWWGHRIPAWHCQDCKGTTVAKDAPAKCAYCGSARILQDPDVLDTWFSSALWPFSTMGWPDDTEDLRKYYPTSLLLTAHDILFFWVARMIIMALKFTGQVPFRQVYLHPLVLDPEGQKMSKSKGTGIDPLELNAKYGTDAMRFTLASMAAPGTNIILSEDRILSSRAFANKIWNAARLIFTQLAKFEELGVHTASLVRVTPAAEPAAPSEGTGRETIVHRWIFSRQRRTTDLVNDALEHFRFHEAAHALYHFFWHDFCDWYLEWVKPEIPATADPTGAHVQTWQRLTQVFSASLRLIHPLMPFLTEELWQRLISYTGLGTGRRPSLAFESFAVANSDAADLAVEREMELLQEIIGNARNIRAELKLDPRRKVCADFSTPHAKVRKLVEDHLEPLLRLATLSALSIRSGRLETSDGRIRSTAQFDLRIQFGEAIDVKAEVARLRKEKERLEKDLESKRNRLADDIFRCRAPAEIVRGLESKLAERQVEYQKLLERLAQLE